MAAKLREKATKPYAKLSKDKEAWAASRLANSDINLSTMQAMSVQDLVRHIDDMD